MPSPNIVSPTSIVLKSIGTSVGTSNLTVVTCPSNKSIKVSSLMAANVTATASSISLRFDDGTATHSMMASIAVPDNATLLCITRENPAYLKEGEKIEAVCDAENAIHLTGSYEEIS
jgi:hypothetical protein